MPFSKIRAVVVEAARREGESRKAYLDEACKADSAFRREVESLLAYQSTPDDPPLAGRFSLPSTITRDGPSGESADADGLVGRTIGPYRILGVLGEGGMGAVYEAIQTTTHRPVALKVIRAGWLDESRVRHFKREIEALGRLDHPAISTIYDAGVTPDGRHYYAMELVRGVTLEDYRRAKWDTPVSRSDLDQRTEILAVLCDAIDHAHRKGVIHRDLKPSNVMLMVDPNADGEETVAVPRLKILDFGLARITEASATGTVTIGVTIKGTLQYMSPEQALGNVDQIDFRTDIYSAGLVAYVLLTGSHPYHVSGGSMTDAVRQIVESKPQDPAEIVRDFPAPLTRILMKALEKEPDSRYQSAAALGADLRRFVARESLSIDEPRRRRRSISLITPQKAMVTAGAAFTIGLLAFLLFGQHLYSVVMIAIACALAATATWLTSRRGRQDAALRLAESKIDALTEFAKSLLITPHPEVAGREVKVLDAIERSLDQLGTAIGAFPDLEGSLRTTIGTVYVGLGRHVEAERELRIAIERLTRAHGRNSLELEPAEIQLGQLHHARLDLSTAERLVRRIHARSRELRGPESPVTMNALGNLAVLLGQQGRLREAIPLYRQSLAARERSRGPGSFAAVGALQALGNALRRVGAYDEAEQLLRRAMAGQSGSEWAPPARLLTRAYLALVLALEGRRDEARRFLDESLATASEDDARSSLAIIAETQRLLGAAALAQHDAMRAMDVIEERHGTRHHPVSAECWFIAGGAVSDQGDHQAGAELVDRGLESIRRARSGWELKEAEGLTERALIALRAGEPKLAVTLSSRARERAPVVVDTPHPVVSLAQLVTVAAYLALDRAPAALSALHGLGVDDEDPPPGWWFSVVGNLFLAIAEEDRGRIQHARRRLSARTDVPPHLWNTWRALVPRGEPSNGGQGGR